MPQSVTQYDLLISCPGDIKEEIEIINRTVQKFNDQFSDTIYGKRIPLQCVSSYLCRLRKCDSRYHVPCCRQER